VSSPRKATTPPIAEHDYSNGSFEFLDWDTLIEPGAFTPRHSPEPMSAPIQNAIAGLSSIPDVEAPVLNALPI
jgi:hypothetical protein